MNGVPVSIWIVLTLAILYPLFKRWLLAHTQPKRLEMARLGKELLVSPELNDKQKKLVEDMLDDAYDGRYMILAVITLPVIVFRIMRRHFRGKIKKTQYSLMRSNDDFSHFFELHLGSTAAANPFMAFVYLLELGFFLVLLILTMGIGIVPVLLLHTAQRVAPKIHGNLDRHA